MSSEGKRHLPECVLRPTHPDDVDPPCCAPGCPVADASEIERLREALRLIASDGPGEPHADIAANALADEEAS